MNIHNKNYHYFCLDAWRGVAALLVLLFHAGGYAIQRQMELNCIEYVCSKFIERLDIGVLLFFVISGYCISASAEVYRERKRFPAFSFLLRRFYRIYPTYWFALIFTLLIALIGMYLNLDLAIGIGNPLLFNGSQWFGNAALIETWRPLLNKSGEALLLSPSWSLCYEVQFYLIMGLMLVLRCNLLYWAIAISGLTLTTMFFHQLVGLQSVYRLFLDGQWLFFVTGVFVFYAIHFKMDSLKRWRLGIYSLVILLLFFGVFYNQIFLCFFAISSAFGLALITTFSDDQSLSSAWAVKPLMFCGKISYSLYLIHLPVCCVLSPLFFSWGFTSIAQTIIITIPACVVTSVCLAVLFYRYFEKPFLLKDTR